MKQKLLVGMTVIALGFSLSACDNEKTDYRDTPIPPPSQEQPNQADGEKDEDNRETPKTENTEEAKPPANEPVAPPEAPQPTEEVDPSATPPAPTSNDDQWDTLSPEDKRNKHAIEQELAKVQEKIAQDRINQLQKGQGSSSNTPDGLDTLCNDSPFSCYIIPGK